jgi:hypothetical protein
MTPQQRIEAEAERLYDKIREPYRELCKSAFLSGATFALSIGNEWVWVEDGLPPLRNPDSLGSIDVIGIQPDGTPIKCYYHYQLKGWYSPETVKITHWQPPPQQIGMTENEKNRVEPDPELLKRHAKFFNGETSAINPGHIPVDCFSSDNSLLEDGWYLCKSKKGFYQTYQYEIESGGWQTDFPELITSFAKLPD